MNQNQVDLITKALPVHESGFLINQLIREGTDNLETLKTALTTEQQNKKRDTLMRHLKHAIKTLESTPTKS